MQLSSLRVAPLVSFAPETLRELLEANATSDTRLEHIQVRAGPNGLQIFAFFRSTSAHEAEARLRRLIATTITSTPALHSWRIV
ncbi:hypothetical protein [Nonomuraea sp. NPDC002799]